MKRKSDKDGTPGAMSTKLSMSGNAEKLTKKSRISNKGKAKEVRTLEIEWPEYFQSVSTIRIATVCGGI